jgi:hypothetical protein
VHAFAFAFAITTAVLAGIASFAALTARLTMADRALRTAAPR